MPALRALVLNIRRVSLNVICRTHDPWRNTNNTPQFLAYFPPSPHPYTTNTTFCAVGPEQITDGSTDDVYFLRPRPFAARSSPLPTRCHGNRTRSLVSVLSIVVMPAPFSCRSSFRPPHSPLSLSLSHQLICPQRSSHPHTHSEIDVRRFRNEHLSPPVFSPPSTPLQQRQQ
jgi:hypothetical protein